jgi:hypothetical protein
LFGRKGWYVADQQRALRLASSGALANHVSSVLEHYTRKVGHCAHVPAITRSYPSHRSVENHLLVVAIVPYLTDEPAASFASVVRFVRRCADLQVSSLTLSMVVFLVAVVICSSIC